MKPLPYAELMERTDAPPGSTWGWFGDMGTVGRLQPSHAKAGAAAVVTGETFRLDYPVDAFDPPPIPTRRSPVHHIFQKHANHRDDYLDQFYLQGTSQIDGLRHQRHPVYGFYNDVPDGDVYPGGGRLGVDVWASSGIVARAVLVDVERYLTETRGTGLRHREGEAFGVDLVEKVLSWQSSVLLPGDVLLLRTGWTEMFLNEFTDDERRRFPRHPTSPGLIQDEATLAWLWDSGIAMVAADNLAVEAIPPRPSPGVSQLPGGWLHPTVISLLGMPLGEMWRLDAIAEACANDCRYEMLLTSAPLYVHGGVGSPANAIAVR